MGRKQNSIHYLYKTTCTITGRYYIGMHSTCDLEDGYLGSGNRLRKSIRKYGEENHVKEILEFFDTRELLVEGEKKAITGEMLVDKNCMNLMSGGTGGFISVEHQFHRSQCGAKKHHERMKTDEQYRKECGLKLSDAVKKTYEDGRKKNFGNKSFSDRNHSDESKQKMSESSRGIGVGKENSQFGSMWITNGKENRKIKRDDVIPESWYKGRMV